MTSEEKINAIQTYCKSKGLTSQQSVKDEIQNLVKLCPYGVEGNNIDKAYYVVQTLGKVDGLNIVHYEGKLGTFDYDPAIWTVGSPESFHGEHLYWKGDSKR